MFKLIAQDKPLPPELAGGVVAIGNFDGVHRGHQAVLSKAAGLARAQARPALALTFEPHPRSYFQPKQPVFRLTPLPEKIILLEALSLEAAVVRDFDVKLAAMPPEEFFEALLRRELLASHIVTGADFHFGKDRKGTPQLLQKLAMEAGMGLSLVPQVSDKDTISSSRIRAALQRGDIAAANALLGYRWFVAGRVEKGDGRGHGLGAPTANMIMPENFALMHGVYAGRACADGFWFGAAIHFGSRLQFGGGAPVLEAHLLDFNGSLYGKTLRIEFMQRLRGEEKFADAGALASQMQADIAQARGCILEHLKHPQTSLQARLDEACASNQNAG